MTPLRTILILLTILTAPLHGSDRKAPIRVLILGDSLTAGYGITPELAYPVLLQNELRKHHKTITVVNAGVSGDTTAGGARRIDWLLKQRIDILVIALGGNDGLRGLKPESTKTNLKTIISKARTKQKNVRILIAGIVSPPNMGKVYTDAFKKTFPEVAEETKVHLIPYILEGVGGDSSMNLADGIHPNIKGHQRICKTVLPHIQSVIKSIQD